MLFLTLIKINSLTLEAPKTKKVLLFDYNYLLAPLVTLHSPKKGIFRFFRHNISFNLKSLVWKDFNYLTPPKRLDSADRILFFKVLCRYSNRIKFLMTKISVLYFISMIQQQY